MKSIISFILFLGWVAGVIIAKGFCSTMFALFVPFWAWYLFIEKILIYGGIL